jgi:hypothetical protein
LGGWTIEGALIVLLLGAGAAGVTGAAVGDADAVGEADAVEEFTVGLAIAAGSFFALAKRDPVRTIRPAPRIAPRVNLLSVLRTALED